MDSYSSVFLFKVEEMVQNHMTYSLQDVGGETRCFTLLNTGLCPSSDQSMRFLEKRTTPSFPTTCILTEITS